MVSTPCGRKILSSAKSTACNLSQKYL